MKLQFPPIRRQPDPGNVTQANAPVAGTLYVQAQAQSVTDLANENKAKINAILTALRDADVIQ